MKNEKYELAETTLLKNKQNIEPIADKNFWENRIEWQMTRISIILNLIIIYQKLNKPLRMYHLVKTFFQNVRVDILFENPQSFEKELEYVFISIAFCCYNLKKYEEAQVYANDGVKFIRKILRNDRLLSNIQEYFKQNDYNFDNFINKKNLTLAKLMNLLGKISERLSVKEEAISNYNQAYNLMRIFAGEESKITISFKQDLCRLKDFSQNPLQKMKTEILLVTNSDIITSPNRESFIRKNVSDKNSLILYENFSQKKNISFGAMSSLYEKPEKSPRKKCVTIHETYKKPLEEHNERVEEKTVRKVKQRPFSANDKMMRKDSLSEYLVKENRDSREKTPDLFKIKIFYPDNKSSSKSIHLNADSTNTDIQSTKLINSLQFDKSSLKSILKSHKLNKKCAETPNDNNAFLLDINDCKINPFSKYSLIINTRPSSGRSQRIRHGKNRKNSQNSPIMKSPKHVKQNFESISKMREDNLDSFRSNKTEKITEELTENNLIIQIKDSNEELDLKITPPKNNTDKVTSPYGRGSLKRNSFSTKEQLPIRLKRKSLLENDFKLNMNEINKTPKQSALNSDKSLNLNKRSRIDIGLFVKQRNDFLLKQATPQQQRNKESIFSKAEGKYLSQKELLPYLDHQDKIKTIQRFYRSYSVKKKKSKNLFSFTSSQFLEKEVEDSIVRSRSDCKFYFINLIFCL